MGAKENKIIMEIYNGNICVTVSELTDAIDGEPVMSYDNLKKMACRKRLEVMNYGGGLGNYARILWSSVPERFKVKFVKKYGNPEDKMRAAAKELKYDEQAFNYFSDESLGLKEQKIQEYTLNASVLNRLIEAQNTQRACRGMAGNSTPIAWDGIIAECDRLREEYGHTLPKSEARLKDKIRQYKKEGYGCLVSGKLSNSNSLKITAEAGEMIVALKRSKFPVYTNAQIFEQYNSIADEKEWKPLKSVSTLVAYLERPEVKSLWFGGAFGELMAKKMLARRHTTLLPQLRDSVWYGDGTKLNLYYKAYVDGKWKAATLYVFEVIDAYSEIFLGYKIGTTENFEMMYWAYRNAVEFAGHMPVELVHDSQGGTKQSVAKDWLSKIARCTRPCTPQQPTSKTIEAIFGRFQAQVLHQYWNYTGGNITARSMKTKVDVDRILKNVDALPTYEELLRIYAEARQQWNMMDHPKYDRPRIQLYEESRNTESVALSPALLRDLFWLTTKDASTFTADGIKIQVEGQTYRYEVFGEDGMPDLDWNAKNIGRRFYVQYDPADMSTVRLYVKDQNYGLQFATEAKPKVVVHRAMQEQTEEERAFIRRQDAANKRQQVFLYLNGLELDRKYGQSFEQHGLRDPKLPGITKAEFERYAEDWRRQGGEPQPAEVLPDTLGKMQKQVSNMTPEMQAKYNAFDRM